MSVCITVHREPTISETFIRSHAERLGGATLLYGEVPYRDGAPWSSSVVLRLYTKAMAFLSGQDRQRQVTTNYLRAFRKLRTDVVLAEYGLAGVLVMEACRRAAIPLIVHFHGYDASDKGVLTRNRDNYKALFDMCASIVVPSRVMKESLVALGAPFNKIFCNAYGVDCDQFTPVNRESSAPVFLTVGRFVEKKGPHLTILAFAELAKQVADARLRMIGDGPLLGTCQDLVRALDIQDKVTFLGAQPHERVRKEMQQARAFVQHSVQALNGDSEGMPVSILEASGSGLPVVSTRHSGIPEIVEHEETGFLVDERDFVSMAHYMRSLALEPGLASRMGAAARKRALAHFSMDRSIHGLWNIIENSTGKQKSKDNSIQ